MKPQIFLGLVTAFFFGGFPQHSFAEASEALSEDAPLIERIGTESYVFDYTNGEIFAQPILSDNQLGAPVILDEQVDPSEVTEVSELFLVGSRPPRSSSESGGNSGTDCRATGCPKGYTCSKTSLLGNRYSCYKPSQPPIGTIGGLPPLLPNSPAPWPSPNGR